MKCFNRLLVIPALAGALLLSSCEEAVYAVAIVLGIIDAATGGADERRAKELAEALEVLNDDSELALSPEQKFFFLCQRGQLDEVEKRLKAGQSPNFLVPDQLFAISSRRSPLIWAAERDNEELLRLLLKYGADVNQRTESGETALHRVLMQRGRPDTDVVELLCEHGADVNAPDSEGIVPLYYCRENKIMDNALDAHYRCEQILRRYGARDDVPTPGLFSMAEKLYLNSSPKCAHDNVAPEVRAYAALQDMRYNLIPFAESEACEHLAVVKGSQRGTAILYELLDKCAGDTRLAPLLLGAGVDPMQMSSCAFGQIRDYEFFFGDTDRRRAIPIDSLYEWVANVDNEQLPAFIETFFTQCHRSVNERDSRGDTLLLAVLRRCGEYRSVDVNILLSSGAEVNVAAHDGLTPLMLAHGNMLSVLLAAGADVQMVDSQGNTALHYLIPFYSRWGDEAENLSALLAAGARPDIRNKDGRTPVDLLREQFEKRKWDMLVSLSSAERCLSSYRSMLEEYHKALELLQNARN